MEIKVRNLHKRFNGNSVLRGVDIDIAPGKITVVLGGSGSGKTVLLKHIAGLMTPDEGAVFIDGNNIAHMSEKELLPIRMRIGFIFQSGSLLNSLTVLENVALGLREHRLASKQEIRRIVEEKLAMVGLEGILDEMPGSLSGGMRKRVAIARALTMDPAAILYDEPTTGVDPPRASRVDQMIHDMAGRTGVASVVVTHDLVSAFGLADSIYFLHEGRMIETGTPEEFRNSPNEIIQKFIARR